MGANKRITEKSGLNIVSTGSGVYGGRHTSVSQGVRNMYGFFLV